MAKNFFLYLIAVTVLSGHISNATGSEIETKESGTRESMASSRAAHPFVQTLANIYVNRTSMTVRISSSADELDLIHGVEALDSGKYDTAELLEGVDIHADFLLERFEIYDPAGNKLEGKVVEKHEWKMPAEGINDGALIDYMLDFTLEYRYPEPPEYLTFQNAIIDYNLKLPSEVKLVVKQAGSDVPFADTMKYKDPRTIRFDWDKPLKNHLTGDELRAWFNETRDKTLGLTSYGGTYSFIYVTPREVRHEVLIPLANLKDFVRLKQSERWYLEVDEQDRAKPLIEKFFNEVATVSINGNDRKPRFDRIDFGGLDVRDFGLRRDRARVSIANGRVGVIMSFPTRNVPDKVTVTWNKFNKMLRDVDVVQISPDDKVEKKQFSKFLSENSVEWTNPGIPPLPDVVDVQVDEQIASLNKQASPWIGYLCAIVAAIFAGLMILKPGSRRRLFPATCVLLIGCAVVLIQKPTIKSIPQEDARDVFAKLHTNLFRSFDYNTEEDVYDALAQTTDGPLLKKIYLDMRSSLEVKEQGGAVSNIDRIEIMEGQMVEKTANDAELESPDFAFRCIWELEGNVEHWGHIHRRTNRYEALFNVRNIDGLWKFTEFQALDQEQGRIVRSVRDF